MKDLPTLLENAFAFALKKQGIYSKRIDEELRSALYKMKGEMHAFYERWAVNGKLSVTELSLSKRYKVMEKEMISILSPAISSIQREIKISLPSQYRDSFLKTAWAIDMSIGKRLPWKVPTRGDINSIFSISKLENIVVSDALRNLEAESAKLVRKALISNLSIGKSYNGMAKDLEKVVYSLKKRSELIMKTEGLRAINLASDDVYKKAKELGITGHMQWSAILDNKVRPDHAAMHEKVKKDDGYYDGPGGERAL